MLIHVIGGVDIQTKAYDMLAVDGKQPADSVDINGEAECLGTVQHGGELKVDLLVFGAEEGDDLREDTGVISVLTLVGAMPLEYRGWLSSRRVRHSPKR